PSPAQLEATELLKRLQRREGLLQGKVVDFARDQRTRLKNTARTLESNGRTVRTWTLFLGATAVIVGLLITVWGAFTLRPLGRLRDAARHIASGDYGNRIDEVGPAEVADLAHEFNVMGHAIQERERELVRSERLVAVGKMAAMITHEVRNPLSSIGLNTELLEEELQALPPERAVEARALCRAITTEVDRLTGITEEYLQFARLPKPKLQRESLVRLVRDLADFEREQLMMRGVTLVVEIDDDLPAVMVDEGQVRQSLLNLLRNAADAVEEVGGGTVSITTRVAAPMVEVRVADEGTGISEELISKLFEPFFSTKDGGTGLGLALTQQIVREHGGDIRVDSEPGHGAVFVMSLPVADTLADAAPDARIDAPSEV
ncbi:MAG TPA: ATP-binding protein, partial [Kofleriaceae bacterium]|nr:ATP-binding protein [Kofleriaceae bacterium]